MSPSEQLSDRRRVRRVSDERILDAAVVEFAANGFAGASVQAIAHGARTTKATIYANLGDKDRLYQAVIDREANAMRTMLLDAYAGVTDEALSQQLEAGIAAIFTFASERPAGFRLLLGGFADEAGEESTVQAVYTDIVEAVSELVRPHLARAGVDSPNACALMASMLVGMFRSAATAAILDHGMDPEAAAAVTRSLAYNALRGLDVELLARLG